MALSAMRFATFAAGRCRTGKPPLSASPVLAPAPAGHPMLTPMTANSLPRIPGLVVEAERPEDGPAIERLTARAFGPGRHAKTAYRLRERAAPDFALSRVARVGTMLVGALRATPVRVGAAPALLIGPVTVDPTFQNRGIGAAMMTATLAAARAGGQGLALLVGDLAYYGRFGFRRAPPGEIILPGPVDPARVLVATLSEGAEGAAKGPVRPFAAGFLMT